MFEEPSEVRKRVVTIVADRLPDAAIRDLDRMFRRVKDVTTDARTNPDAARSYFERFPGAANIRLMG